VAVAQHAAAARERVRDGTRDPVEVLLRVARAALEWLHVRLSAAGRGGLAGVELLALVGVVLESLNQHHVDAFAEEARARFALAHGAVHHEDGPTVGAEHSHQLFA
jgi:hypothetical protein